MHAYTNCRLLLLRAETGVRGSNLGRLQENRGRMKSAVNVAVARIVGHVTHQIYGRGYDFAGPSQMSPIWKCDKV